MNNLRAVPRGDVSSRAWDDFVLAHRDGWWWHTSAWIKYALAYTRGARDGSMAICCGDDLVAIVPSILDESGVPIYGGQMCPAPLRIDGLSMALPGGHPQLRIAWRPGREADQEAQTLFTIRPYGTYVADLWDGDESDQWRRLRRSYRSLVHQAEKRYEIAVYSHCEAVRGAPLILRAQMLHRIVAGRQTRCDATWGYQTDWLNAGHGVLVLAIDQVMAEDVGFAYGVRYKDWAYWCSGATTRPNVQHALQWHLMRALRCDGRTRYYEFGWDVTDKDDEKGRNIAFFKSGFGGTRWTFDVLEDEKISCRALSR